MKNKLILVLIIAVIITACTNPLAPANGTALISINTGLNISAEGSKGLSDVASFKLTISADDMTTIEQTFTEPSFTIEIEAGADRTFKLDALDANGNILYSGSTTVTLIAGEDAVVQIEFDYSGFLVNFNTGGAGTLEQVYVTAGETLTEPSGLTKTGFSIEGWYTDSSFTDAWDFTSDTVTSDMTLYVKWAEGFSITFFSNGGSEVLPQFIYSGEKAIRPAIPTLTDFGLAGWYTDNGTWANEWLFDTNIVSNDVNLYAKWDAGFNVTYVMNGGTNHIYNPLGYATSFETITLETPTKASWTFTGWYSNSTFTTEAPTIPAGGTSDLTYYAKWSTVYPGTTTISSDESLVHGAGYYADYWKISYSTETTVTIDMECSDFDSYLAIHDDTNTIIANIDDGGEGVDARLTQTFEANRDYYIEATSLSSGYVGDYVLELSSTAPDVYMELAPKPY